MMSRGRIYMKVNENLDKFEEQEVEEDGMVENLDLDMEIVDHDADYFVTVSEDNEPIYIRQDTTAKKQSSTTSQKFSSQNGSNGATKILWTEDLPVIENSNSTKLNNNNDNNTKILKSTGSHNKRKIEDVEKNQEITSKDLDSDSLDLFFQSMAQTVLQLPPHVQAGIKMEICKVISTAEIKYSAKS